MSDNYTTKTAALRTTTHNSFIINTKKLFVEEKTEDGSVEKIEIRDLIDKISGKTFYDERGENVTEHDLWGTSVTTDEKVVKIENKNISGLDYCSSNAITTNDLILKDNKLTKDGEAFSNIQTEKLTDGIRMFEGVKSVEVNADFSNLKNGESMFYNTSLAEMTFDLPSLVYGKSMFAETDLPSSTFSKTLDSLMYGESMFNGTKSLVYFYSNIPYCYNAEQMFADSNLLEFRGSATYVYNGKSMFRNSKLKYFVSSLNSLVCGLGMFENTNLSIYSIEKIAKSLPMVKGHTIIKTVTTDETTGETTENYTVKETFKNGVSFKYSVPLLNADNIVEDTSISLTTLADETGIITITWADPSTISVDDLNIIEHEYFPLMVMKGWTIVTNLRENENGTQFIREYDTTTHTGLVGDENNVYKSVGTMILGPKASNWTETEVTETTESTETTE